MTERWPDLAGRIEGETHVLPVRVYFEDTDCAGVVYHANFLKFCERARSDFIRLLGIDAKGLANPEQGEPSVFVVRRVEIDYLKPGRMDDLLEVVTTCAEIGSASLVLQQDVMRDGDAAGAGQGHGRSGLEGGQTAAARARSFVTRFNDSLTNRVKRS